jgi:hypothetical protein
MRERRDKYSGNILLYDYLSTKRAPVFLNRNLKRAFQIHEHILSYGNTENYPESDNNFRSKWQPPSWELLDTMIAKEKAAGSFVLEVHSFQLKGNQRNAPSDRDEDPARKVQTLLRLSSTITVSILLLSSNIQSIRLTQEAVVRGVNKNTNRQASIEADHIIIRPEDLGGDHGQITHDEAYKMMVSVTFAGNEVAEELFRYMGLDVSKTSCYLSAHYDNILNCPTQRKILLPLKVATKPIGIDLEVSMGWNDNAGASVLEHCNQLQKAMRPPRSYPTPPLDAETRFRLIFVYGTESLERSELVCPHCTRRKASADIQDLQLHLLSWHDLFEYKVTQESVDTSGVEHWRFESELADHRAVERPRASDHADEPFDVRVLAPARPFDRRKYFQGDDGYQRAARIEKPSKHTKAKAVDVPTMIPLRRHRKPPDEVQDRPQRIKKSYVVPRAPSGITFFRSFSKRPLRQGEAISESDDELDEGWMHLRKHTEVEKEGLSATVTRFLNVYDDFMHDESLHSDTHAGDAIIRFSQHQGVRLWQEGIYDEFKKKLDELLEDEIISKEVHVNAREIVVHRKPTTTAVNKLSQRLAELNVQHEEAALGPAGHKANKGPPPRFDRKGKGKAAVTETGHLTPITADSDGDVDVRDTSLHELPDMPNLQDTEDGDPPYDLCYCGEDASATPGSSGIIACSSIVRHSHHYSYVYNNN